jgi:hypothetical protein
MYNGPYLNNTGLVFGYDTGIGVSTNDVATRLYPGDPTTNLIPNANTMASWSTYYRTVAATTFITEFGTTGYRFTNQPSWNGIVRGFNLGSSGTYTFSAWFKYIGGSSSNNGATVYISNYGGGDTAVAINKSLIGVWQRLSHTVNVTSPTNVLFYLISYGGVDNGTGNPDFSSWEITMPQIELGSIRTPFVNGTRSATEALIDAKRATTIDLSTVSFNSSAQPTFDGTDDFIDTNFGSATIPQVTLEAVVYRSTATGRYEAIIQNNVASDDALYVYPNGTLGFWPCTPSSLTVPAGQWSYVAVTYNGSSYTYYVNSNSQTVNAVCADITDFDFLRIGAHGSGDGERWIGQIPVARVYNRALSATEISQNYQAFKPRFGI